MITKNNRSVTWAPDLISSIADSVLPDLAHCKILSHFYITLVPLCCSHCFWHLHQGGDALLVLAVDSASLVDQRFHNCRCLILRGLSIIVITFVLFSELVNYTFCLSILKKAKHLNLFFRMVVHILISDSLVLAWSMDDPQVRCRAVCPSMSFIVTSG